jgi:hypothetical protein
MSTVENTGEDAQESYFRITSKIPEETWYWLAVASILLSAGFKLAKKDHEALFVGQWPPTFLLFGLYQRIVKPKQ